MLLRLISQNVEPTPRYTGGGLPKGVVIIIALVLLYFLPSMLAFAGGKRRKWKIVAVNVLAGWTIIGWIASMIMNWAYEAPIDGEESATTSPSVIP
jgi:multisubunit Na+/H+ antiporter MnhB subunit